MVERIKQFRAHDELEVEMHTSAYIQLFQSGCQHTCFVASCVAWWLCVPGSAECMLACPRTSLVVGSCVASLLVAGTSFVSAVAVQVNVFAATTYQVALHSASSFAAVCVCVPVRLFSLLHRVCWLFQQHVAATEFASQQLHIHGWTHVVRCLAQDGSECEATDVCCSRASSGNNVCSCVHRCCATVCDFVVGGTSNVAYTRCGTSTVILNPRVPLAN
jgi:hypothetical protein